MYLMKYLLYVDISIFNLKLNSIFNFICNSFKNKSLFNLLHFSDFHKKKKKYNRLRILNVIKHNQSTRK